MAESRFGRELALPRLPARVERIALRAAWPAMLVAVVLIGATLRFNGLDWDQPAGASSPIHLHPDERHISIVTEKIEWPSSIDEYFDTAASPLNPYNAPDTPSFVYGTFPVFLAKAVANLPGDALCRGDSYDTTVVCGRKLTAAFDTATILLVIALGTLLLGRGIGLIAGLLYALAVLPTQLAHFWTTDPYVVFFGVATMVLSVLVVQRTTGPPRDAATRGERAHTAGGTVALAAALGIAIGLGLASKVTAWPIVLAPVLATAIRICLRDFPRLDLRWRGAQPSVGGSWAGDLALLLAAGLVAFAVFRIAQPYAFAGGWPGVELVSGFPFFGIDLINPQWRADLVREVDFQNGNVDFPPFVQFAGRATLLWPLGNVVLWGMGPALGIAAWASVGAAIVLAFRRRELVLVLPIVLIAAVVGFQGTRFVAYMRYFAPAYPALCLLAAWGLGGIWGLAFRQGRPPQPLAGPNRLRRVGALAMPGTRVFRYAASAVVIVVFAATAWWALAFQNVYTSEHPRIAASRWMYENIPPGSSITTEIWDDRLPLAIPGTNPAFYPVVETYPFDTDSAAKVYALMYGRGGPGGSPGLAGADYVAITSDRVRSAVQRLPLEYPATIRYYELLASGALGFELVAHFEVRPSFLGLRVDDSSAEESFTVYDHPEVWIYRKTADFDAGRAVALLMEAHPERAVNLLPKQGRTNGLMLTPSELEAQRGGGTFSDIFSGDGLVASVPWLFWLAWIELAAFAAVPWVTWLFRAVPDRGYGLTKLLGFAGVALATWLVVAWDAAHFSATLVWAVFALFLAGGAALGFRRRRALLADLRERWPAWLAVELLFLAVFFAFLGLRATNPDLWYHPQGGEKPVELAYLTAVARSTTLPPYDPWFAGGVMNYYYMGWFILATPMRALRILPEVGFNIGLATYAALSATVAFSTVHNLVGLARRYHPPNVAPPGWRRPAVLAGIGGAVLLIGIGNLDAAHQTLERLQALNTWDTAWGTGANAAWDVPFAGEPMRLLARFAGGTVGFVGGAWHWILRDAPMPPFDWWRPSRVHIGHFDITEFPYFSTLFGDLHAHLMGIPFFGLVIALGVAYVATAASGQRRHSWAIAAGLGLALGLVRTVHTWDFPTAVLLASAAIVAGQLLAAGRWQQRWWDGGGHLAVAAAFLLVPFAPYTTRFEVFETGIVRARETTSFHQYLAHFGLFVAILVAFLAVRYHEELRLRRGDPGRNPFLVLTAGPWQLASFAIFLAGLSAITWRYGLTTVALSAIALLFLANLLWLDYRRPRRDLARLLATAMFGAAIGIAGGIDIIQAEYDIVRMNTVFKFSLQAWQLYALASGFGLWYVGRALWYAEGWRVVARPGRGFAAGMCAVAIGGLLYGSAIYTWSGTRVRQDARFEGSPAWTLDGLAYLPYGYFVEDHGDLDPANDEMIALGDDAPLIAWLRDNVEGSPVVAEAVGQLYHWTSRISWNTGLPTVVGWDWHTVAYRGAYDFAVQQRRFDTKLFYETSDVSWAQHYVDLYDVSYVVVGTTEQVLGTPEGIAKFATMAGLTEVFRSGEYAIYRVDRD